MTQLMKCITKVNMAKTKGTTLKSTIPKAVVQSLRVSAGDSIEWIIETKNDKVIVTVVPQKSLENLGEG